MSYLATSTHLNNWIFTKDELAKIAHLKANKVRKQWQMCAANPILQRKPRSFACLLPASTNAELDASDWSDTLEDVPLDPIEDESIFLSPDEEAMVIDFYEVQVQNTCTTVFKTSDKVKAAAVLLFKRFYLSNSIMEFHPKYIGATAIYVAGKVEEQYISVEGLVKLYEGVIKETDVIAHEMIVLEGVRFQLIMYHPFRALTGFIDDLRAYYKSRGADISVAVLQTLHATATALIHDILLTDSPFLYAPACLALAGLHGAITPEMNINLVEYVTHCKRSKSHEMQAVVRSIEAIVQLRTDRANTIVTDAQLKPAYKKLKAFYKSSKSSDKDKEGKESNDKEPKKKKHKSEKKSKKSKKEGGGDDK
ncbi:Aste57867_13801 [Aphanomyces stellatus]|uniref:Aste57867_13801 protein n=1 Tax=Aphanomyces stellatus TaxID=120398 RepID=A0A485KZM2_9STRA|nr:hypothetical protein As57867_013751 [Aphanomyces stellatus]VFT90633.1 Aste57867_13801 [Aphanomyces stellatus]